MDAAEPSEHERDRRVAALVEREELCETLGGPAPQLAGLRGVVAVGGRDGLGDVVVAEAEGRALHALAGRVDAGVNLVAEVVAALGAVAFERLPVEVVRLYEARGGVAFELRGAVRVVGEAGGLCESGLQTQVGEPFLGEARPCALTRGGDTRDARAALREVRGGEPHEHVAERVERGGGLAGRLHVGAAVDVGRLFVAGDELRQQSARRVALRLAAGRRVLRVEPVEEDVAELRLRVGDGLFVVHGPTLIAFDGFGELALRLVVVAALRVRDGVAELVVGFARLDVAAPEPDGDDGDAERDEEQHAHPAREPALAAGRAPLLFGVTLGLLALAALAFEFRLALLLFALAQRLVVRAAVGEEAHGEVELGVVARAPRGVRRVAPLPFERVLHGDLGERALLPFAVEHGGLGETAVDARGLRLFVHPLLQTLPVADQTLVRDVDDRLGIEADFGGRHQERAARAAERVHDGDRPRLRSRR